MKGLIAVMAGMAAGVAAEQLAVRQPWRPDPLADEPFGSVRGEPHWMRASDGTELYVEVQPADDPSAPTVIFSHGYCLNQDSWHFQRKALNGRVRIVAWDQRGHGRSERGPAAGNSIEQLGTDLQSVIQAFGADRVTLVGHSMGGMTIMGLADQFPDTIADAVQGVALVATSAGDVSPRLVGLPAGVSHRARSAVTSPRLSRRAGEPWIQGARYTDLNFLITKRASVGSKAPNSLSRFTLEMLNATPMDTVLDFLPALMTLDKYEALKVLRDTPAFVTVGESDVMTPPSHTRRILQALPHARSALFADTGHMVQLERADDVTAAIEGLVFGEHAP